MNNALPFRCLLTSLCLIFSGTGFAQTEPHWEDLVIFGAGYMGPNALPVPTMNRGRTMNVNSLSASGMAYFSRGEQTYNPNTAANICVVKDLVAFDLFMVPVEFFQMSPTIRSERVPNEALANQNYAIGDVYINSTVQIISRPRFHIAIRTGFKIPSSSQVAQSRFTDSPGYNLDAGFGGFLYKNEAQGTSLELFAMAGFYSYQTQGGYANYRQNDAFLFGAGLEAKKQGWVLNGEIRGYLGYFNLRDQPILVRAQCARQFHPLELFAAFQVGVNDLYYLAPELGVRVFFPDLGLGTRL